MAQITSGPAPGFTDIGTKTAQFRHPLFISFAKTWEKLSHVREGIGGFMDGTYLEPHPREWVDHKAENPKVPTKKLKERRRLARYENFAATIIDQMKAALFREQPTRVLGKYEGQTDREPAGIEGWWQDVDGNGTHIDDFVPFAWDPAATLGHVVIYMDRQGVPGATGTTAAENPQPILRAYTPLDVADWLTDDQGNLTAVKLLEIAPRLGFKELPSLSAKYRYRIVDETDWKLYDHQGKQIDGGPHMMGTLPIVVLYCKRRPLIQHIGQSILHDPQLFIDLYNLDSELRELLRKQTFSLLNIPLGTGPDAMGVEAAKALLNTEVSTEGVIFSGPPAGFITADAANVAAYQEERSQLLRMIYRLAGVTWESDSKDAEAEGSLKLKREDTNQRLSNFADELEKADIALCQLWYRAQYGERWETEYESDQVLIQYPQNFDVTPFDVVLEQAQAAMSLGFPPEVLKAIRKRLLVKFLPDLGPNELKDLTTAIDEMEDDVTPQESGRANLEAIVRGDKKPTKEAA
jgi:hypothetical protein